MKKLMLAALLSALAVVSIYAQGKLDNFLGTWKLTKSQDAPRGVTTKALVLKVLQFGDLLTIECAVEASFDKKNIYAFTTNKSFKISGGISTQRVDEQPGGTVRTHMRFLHGNKLRLDTNIQMKNNSISSREVWRVSDDGKTLIIETYIRSSFSKWIFSKQ